MRSIAFAVLLASAVVAQALGATLGGWVIVVGVLFAFCVVCGI